MIENQEQETAATEEHVNEADGNDVELNDEERRDLAEKYIVDLLHGMNMAGQAINRLEGFCFALVKIIIDKNLATLEEVEAAKESLMNHDDIRDFWGAAEEVEEAKPTEEA